MKIKRLTRLSLAFSVFVALCPAQVIKLDGIEVLVTTLGIPCEPGESLFPDVKCPPIESQGVLVQVRSDDWSTANFDTYSVTVKYLTPSKEGKTATLTVNRERDFGKSWDDGWRAVGFNIGRMAMGQLTGITIVSVAVAKVPKPVVITIGPTRFGPP